MNAIWQRIKAQPVLVTNLVQSVLILAVTFGLHVTNEQTGLILVLTNNILAFVAASGSTSTSAPTLPVGTAVTVTTPQGQPNTVTTL